MLLQESKQAREEARFAGHGGGVVGIGEKYPFFGGEAQCEDEDMGGSAG
jgi:hypothetical protein